MEYNSSNNDINYNNNDISISLTFSDSNDYTQEYNTIHNLNDLEISYKSAFCTDKKCTTPLEQKIISKQIECKTTLFKPKTINKPTCNEYFTGTEISTKNTATTNEKTDSKYDNNSTTQCYKKNSHKQNFNENQDILLFKHNSAKKDENELIQEQKIMEIKSINEMKKKHFNKEFTNIELEKHHHPLTKRCKSSIFNIDFNKIKIDTIINPSCIPVCPNNSNPCLKKNNNAINYTNKHTYISKPINKNKNIFLKKSKPSTYYFQFNKALSTRRVSLHTYLEQMINKDFMLASQNKLISQKSKLLKKTNHSHREKEPHEIILFNNRIKPKQKQSTSIVKNTTSSCLFIKTNQNKLKQSKSTNSIFNISSFIIKEPSFINNSKNKRFHSTLNTPMNKENKKIDSRNSILKPNLIKTINKKHCNTPRLSSSLFFGNSNVSQRNNCKKINIQNPLNIFNNKRNGGFVIKDNFKTNPSSPNNNGLNNKINYTINNKNVNTHSNLHTVIKCMVNNKNHLSSGSSNTNKKSPHNLNNFSKCVKHNRKNKKTDRSLYSETLIHNKNISSKIYFKPRHNYIHIIND